MLKEGMDRAIAEAEFSFLNVSALYLRARS